MRTGSMLFLLCICFTYSTIISQNQNLSKDSLELSFYPISGLENYHSENDCKITGSAWIDSLSVKINLTVKDDYLKLDKPYNKGDFIEIIFAVPELKDSGNFFISTQRAGNFVYEYKQSNDLNSFKKEWKSPLINLDDENRIVRYNKIKGTGLDCLMDEKLDPKGEDKPYLKYIPYGITHLLIYPKLNKIVNGNFERFIEKEIESGNRDVTDITKNITYNSTINSGSYDVVVTIPIKGFSYVSRKFADEIRFLIKIHDIDSTTKQSTVFSSCNSGNEYTYSKFNCVYPERPFGDSEIYSRILPDKFNLSFSPIFLNTLDEWLPIEKYSENINSTRSTCHWYTPNLQTMMFRIGIVEHHIDSTEYSKIDIYSLTDFSSPNISTDYVIKDDSLIMIVDNFIRHLYLNSGKIAYIISEEEYEFGECRETQYCGCGTYENYFLITYQDLITKKSNKLQVCTLNLCSDNTLFFYPNVTILEADNERYNALTFNKFKDNTFTLRFSDKKIVKIKVDEEKWRLIFIKNW
jgi:hypothetical protein